MAGHQLAVFDARESQLPAMTNTAFKGAFAFSDRKCSPLVTAGTDPRRIKVQGRGVLDAQQERGNSMLHAATPTASALSLRDAVLRGIQSSDSGNDHRHNQELAANQLLGFMEGKFHILEYQDLKQVHVRAFVDHLVERKMSANTIRGYTNPLRLASNYAEDYCDLPPLSVRRLPKRHEKPKAWLNLEQLQTLYDTAEEMNAWQTMLMVRLCGLCGLRLTELMRLEPGDFEVTKAHWLLNVAARSQKNAHSERLLPIPQIAAKEFGAFHPYKRTKFVRRTSWSRQCADVLRAAYEKTGDEAFARIAPKDLRKTLPNVMAKHTETKFVAAFLGHTMPQWSTTQRHYEAKTPRKSDPESVRTAALANLQERVTDKLEKMLAKGIKKA